MTADLRRSPLGHRAGELDVFSSPALTIAELPFLPMTSLRGDGSDPELPGPGRATASAVWMGPDEWLVFRPAAEVAGRAVDVSAHRTVLELTGPAAVRVLEHGCAIDLHPRVFGPGSSAVTLVGRVGVVLWMTAPQSYRLAVRSSFADYLADWLLDAGLEHRV